MSIKHFLVLIILATLVSDCAGLTESTASPTAIGTYEQKQPEPGRPQIGGEITGVLENTLVTFHVQTPEGWEVLWGTRLGNGTWEAVIAESSSPAYTVKAEADGFLSTPNSYSIQLAGNKAYFVENGRVTTKEAVNLDFNFTPAATTNPAP